MNQKKLYRNTDNKVFAGVCAGIADYLAVDVTVVRLLTVLFALLTGVGFVVYLLAIFIVPVRDV